MSCPPPEYRELRRILDQAERIETRYSDLKMPLEAEDEIVALLRRADALQLKIAEMDQRRRLNEIYARDNFPTQATIDAYTAAFGPDKAPDVYWAMRQGC